MEKLFFKPIIVSKDDMDKFEPKKMKKIRPAKNTWYNWLSNFIPEPLTISVGGFKDKNVCLFKKNTPKQTIYGRGKKPKTQDIRNHFILKKIKDRIIREVWTLFETEEEKTEKEKLEKNNNNNRIIKDRIIRDIMTLFAQEEDYYKTKKVNNFCSNNYIE